MRFAKPALSLVDQINLLERRGLVITDRPRAEHWLQFVSYYRLRAYWLPFETGQAANGDHQFHPGTTFEDVAALYVFDRRLRLLVMDAFERIEVAVRGSWAHHLAMRHGSHGYLNPALYDRRYFNRALESLEDEIARSKDTFIAHYLQRYNDPALPPVWMAAELVSFGQLSKWISNLAGYADRKAISRSFGIDESVLTSYLHHAAHVRNICAHHGRLWNKRFVVRMTLPRHPRPLAASLNVHAPSLLYNTLAMAAHLLQIVAPQSTWRAQLVELLDQSPHAAPAAMGFPADWKARPIWNLP